MTLPSLLITRPKASADSFIARLSGVVQTRISIVISPLMQIVPLGDRPDLTGVAGVIFTSANAVEFGPVGNGRPAYCVGQKTAKFAHAAGWHVLTVAENADRLVAYLSNTDPVGPLLHLAGRYRRGEIAKRVTAQGTQVDVTTLYDQQLLPLSDDAQMLLNGEGRVVVPLFSPRTAAQFVDQAQQLNRVTVIAMSDAVAAVCNEVSTVVVVATPTAQEMVRCVEKTLCDTTSA